MPAKLKHNIYLRGYYKTLRKTRTIGYQLDRIYQPAFRPKKTPKKLFGVKVGLGFGWDRTENVLWRIHHGELDGCRAKTIFLLIGTNNLPFNTDEEVVEGIIQITKAIRQRQPQAKLFVLGILPRKGMESRVGEVNNLLRSRLIDRNTAYIDLAPRLTDDTGAIIPALFLDGLHPNEAGYERIAEVLCSYL